MAMGEIFARLELLQEVPLKDGGAAKEVIVFRPNGRDLMEVLAAKGQHGRLYKFVERVCRVKNGAGFKEFDAKALNVVDAAEFTGIVNELIDDSQKVELGEFDGVFEPLVYSLAFPIFMARDNPEAPVIKQIAFKARSVGEMSEYFDAVGTPQEFYAFMRGFGELLGTKLPMSDSVIDALDAVDYLVIRSKIMGKLANPRGRWRRTST